jgi:hypothetical protein
VNFYIYRIIVIGYIFIGGNILILSKYVYTSEEMDENKKDNATRNGTQEPEDQLPTHYCIVKETRPGPYYGTVRECFGRDEWIKCAYCSHARKLS